MILPIMSCTFCLCKTSLTFDITFLHYFNVLILSNFHNFVTFTFIIYDNILDENHR